MCFNLKVHSRGSGMSTSRFRSYGDSTFWRLSFGHVECQKTDVDGEGYSNSQAHPWMFLNFILHSAHATKSTPIRQMETKILLPFNFNNLFLSFIFFIDFAVFTVLLALKPS